MIDKIVVGSGSGRKEISMVRDRRERKSVAGAIKGFLFPNKEAHDRAMAQGRRNREAHRLVMA